MTGVFADRDLARRLERALELDLSRFAASTAALYPALGAEYRDFGDGAALWMGPESPVNIAAGFGMDGEVAEDIVDEVECFYSYHVDQAKFAVCPLADVTLLRALGSRGFAPCDFENVLVRELDALPAEEPDPSIEISIVAPGELGTWIDTVAYGFSDGAEPTEAEMRLAQVVAHRDNVVLLLARVDGVPAGTGELVVDDAVGWLSADTTLPAYRGRGVQTAMQLARLRLAREAGCELAVTEATPGSPSQRNMERRGFRIVYTRVEMTRLGCGLSGVDTGGRHA